MFSKRPVFVILVSVCAAVFVLAAYFVAEHRSRADIHAAGDRQLQIIALDVESVLEKFETLPFYAGISSRRAKCARPFE